MIDLDDVQLSHEAEITEILHLEQHERNVTRQMLRSLPRFSLETLALLRLYGPRSFCLVDEDAATVSVLNDAAASEDDLFKTLQLAHVIHGLRVRQDFDLFVLREKNLKKVSYLFAVD